MSLFRQEQWDKNSELLDGMERHYQKSLKALKSTKWAKYRRAFLYLHCQHNIDDVPAALRAVGKEYFLESSLFRPMFAQQVLGIKPRLKDALEGQDPPWMVQPHILADGKELDSIAWEQCKNYQEYLTYQLAKQVYWRELLDPLIFDALLYTQAILRLTYKKTQEPLWQVEDNASAPGGRAVAPQLAPQVEGLEGVQAWGIAEERVKGELVSPFHWFPDIDGHSLRGRHDNEPVRFVQETSRTNLEDLMVEILADPLAGWQYPEDIDGKRDTKEVARAAAAGDPSAKAELAERVMTWLSKHRGKGDAEEDYGRKLQAEVGKLTGSARRNDEEDSDRLPLLTFWGAGPDPWYMVRVGGAGGELLCKRRGRQHPSMFSPIPHVIYKPEGIANELFGFGLIDLLDKLQRELNAWTNITLSSFKESMNGLTILNGGLGMTAEKIRGAPDRYIAVSNPGGLPLTDFMQHIERNVPEMSGALSMLKMISDECNMTGSLSEVVQGSSNMRGTPVRSYALAVDQSGKRMGGMASNMGNQAGEMGEVLHGLNRQYLLRGRWFQLPGQTGPESMRVITEAVAQRKYEIAFNCKPVVVNEALQLQNHTQFGTINGAAEEFNRVAFILDHAKLLHIPNPERYVIVHPKDADMENEFFYRNGYFPWPAQRDDDAELHLQTHGKMADWVNAQEQQGNPMPKTQLAMHMQTHAAQMAAPMQGAGGGMPTMPGGRPGAPAAGPTMPPMSMLPQGGNRGAR